MKVLFFILFILNINLIFSQSHDIESKRFSFLYRPFLDESILFPNIDNLIFSSFDEIFDYFGNPIGEFQTNHPGTVFEGNYTRGLRYKHFDIATIYIASRDIVIIYLIWIHFNEDIILTYDIQKNDTPNKIINIFGEPNQIANVNNNVVEFTYDLCNISFRVLRFQFTNNKLSAIIYIHTT